MSERESKAGRTFEPGPWFWEQAYDVDGFVFWVGPPVDGNIPARRQVQHTIEWEHCLDPDDDPEQFEEAEAIANLIVAAPLLLEACRKVRDTYGAERFDPENLTDADGERFEAMLHVVNAIARAESGDATP